ncbi:transglycosylase SLT domain-containing protein [Endozoicomonas euniceicola]|uniref:Transglycosylase SLT domain-containing protein n=1 Tax=Endozoicomonas euniceicola TaxID=1234143 RepID=A0ABY6GQN5_9GAMM|nr:hypothetical protein [Endozoicomonas euniceicola]UYM15066.1 hypothetical protein NX720_19665 [Endozoicomonas euniceicola]
MIPISALFLRKGFSKNSHIKKLGGLILLISLLLTGCSSTAPPSDRHNLCSIFREKPSWYKAAKKSQKKWGTPVQVQMAIMYQESSFRHNVRPPRPYFLFIPLPRKSSAYGYAQAQDGTWQEYLDETGGWFKSRDDFADAIDFIGWYTNKVRRVNGVSLWRADQLYLNYHEGMGGYRRGSYKSKPWLMNTARRVKSRASNYGEQLRRCKL